MVLFDTHKLAAFNEEMYSQLIYKHHVLSKNKKLIDFKDDEEGGVVSSLTGYEALKGETRYLLQGCIKDDLPIKINDDLLPVQVTKTGDVSHIVPYNTDEDDFYVSFKIKPEKMMSYNELLSKADQKHSTGDEFTLLYGNLLYAALCSRINVCVSGNVSSGKSSYIDCMNNIYDGMPRIEKPSSAPALAKGVTTEGVLAVDELSGLKTKEQKAGVETVLNSQASGSNTISYGTAGSKAYRTMNPPPTNHLSVLIVYNTFGTAEACRKNIRQFPFKPSYYKQEDFFDWMWSNQASLVDRFVRFKMPDGKLDVSQFLNNAPLNGDEKTTLKRMAKTVAYYKLVARKNFVEGVCGQPPELSKDDVDYILDYIKVGMGVGDDSRYLSSLLEILKFAMVASGKDRTRFKWYADGYARWMDDYQDMINLVPPKNSDSFENGTFKVDVSDDANTPHVVKTIKMDVKSPPLQSFEEIMEMANEEIL